MDLQQTPDARQVRLRQSFDTAMTEYRRIGAFLAELEPEVEEVTTTPQEPARVAEIAAKVEAAQASMSAFVPVDTERERVRRLDLAISAGAF